MMIMRIKSFMRNEKSFDLFLRKDNMIDVMCSSVGAISTITNHKVHKVERCQKESSSHILILIRFIAANHVDT